MIRRSALIASAIAVLAVAGCSGNDNDSSPSPTPTPTPTPTGTATPTYTSFPLTAATELFTVSASTSFTGNPAVGPVVLGAAATDAYSNRVRFALQNTSAVTSAAPVVVRENTEESRFDAAADLAVAPAPAVTEYVFVDATPAAGTSSRLELLNNTIPSQVTSNSALALTRSTYGAWVRGDTGTGARRITYAIGGYPTALSDMPTTAGPTSYTVNVVARSVIAPAAGAGQVNKLAGTATVSINYATGVVSLTLNLTGYGTFNGTGAIAAGNNQFTGSFGAGSTAGGTFQGIAFGPQAAEIGITFAISDNGATPSRAVGAVVGKKS